MAVVPESRDSKAARRKSARPAATHLPDTLVVDLSRLTAEPMAVIDPGAGADVMVRGGKSAARASIKEFKGGAIGADDRGSVKDLLTHTLASIAEVREHATEPLSPPELLRRVGTALVEKAEEQGAAVDAATGWQQLLERGLRFKTRLLNSGEFKTTAAASQLIGVGEAAIRKRIRAGRLFALAVPGSDEHRIPVWALDPAISGEVTSSLWNAANGLDAWALYHFLTTPHGRLQGLRPFEALMGLDLLAPLQKTRRRDLAVGSGLPASHPLAARVIAALQAEVAENSAA